VISSQQLGERLEAARKAQRLTQADVAQRLGVSRQTVIAMEKGERRPTSEQLMVLADALATSVHELVRERYVRGEPSPRFRATLRASSEELQQAERELVRVARRYAELEQLLGMVRTPAQLEVVATWQVGSPADRLDPAFGGEDAAKAVRQMLGLGDAPCLSLEAQLERAAGLRIFNLPLPANVAALFVWSDDLGGCVGINVKHPHERRRWSLGHETGHFLRDREAGDVLPTPGHDAKDPSEIFADAFARALLLPADAVARQFADRVRANGGAFAAADIIAMAHQYEVSFQAMTLRLEGLALLPRGTWERLAAQNIRPREVESRLGIVRPSRAASPPTFPERYVSLALEAFERELIGEGDLAEYLGTDRVSARGIHAERRRQSFDDEHVVEVDLGLDMLAAG
jgi:Zn-dependent peptidase ImmA (M78 family)/transcriptional regulator with XRE-family HTH domain